MSTVSYVAFCDTRREEHTANRSPASNIIPEFCLPVGAKMSATSSEPAAVAALRRAVKADGRSAREIARAAGLHHASLARFLKGESNLSFTYAAQLFPVVGLELVPTKPR